MYADDMVLVASRETDLQKMLDTLYSWCKKWRLSVNKEKTKIVHFRTSRTRKTNYNFNFDKEKLEIVPHYKYLGVIMDEHLTFERCSQTLADSGGRALGAIWAKFKLLRNVGLKTYTKMFETGVVPILDYSSGVWNNVKQNHSDIIQNKAIRYYMGVHNFTPHS